MGRSYRKTFLLGVKKNLPQSKLLRGGVDCPHEVVSSILSLVWRLERHNPELRTMQLCRLVSVQGPLDQGITKAEIQPVLQ